MAGYIGSKAAVTQVDGYTKTEADARYVEGDDTLVVDQTNNRVGIGTSSPSAPLTVNRGSDGNNVYIDNNGTQLAIGSTSSVNYINTQNGAAALAIKTNATERMRLDSSGRLLCGLTSAYTTSTAEFKKTGSGEPCVTVIKDGWAAGSLIQFVYGSSISGAVGSITTNGSSTSYNTTSDYRLKENVTDVTDGITRVKQLEPKRFNFIADPDTTVDGFLAHEAQLVVPEAVTGEKDEVDADGNAVMQGIDQAKLVPLLTAALQEAITEIETLKTKVAALEAG